MPEHDARIITACRAMHARDRRDPNRGVSPLELFFDLCFVAAIAQITTQLTQAVTAGGTATAIASYLTVFFAIWWAWMNFTWFASAFDNDDICCRLAAFVQMVGALILASGTAEAFTRGDFAIVFLGYAVMRLGLVASWLRAARWNPEHRGAAVQYAIGLSVAMAGWSTMLAAGAWPLWGWCLMALVELAIPPWAESRGSTPWNPHHVARRNGRFVIIVLGQSVIAVTGSVRIALDHGDAGVAVYSIIAGGLLLVFSMWWLYFAASPPRFLTTSGKAFMWGYGHYFVLCSAAAVGAGIAANLDLVTAGSPATGAPAAAALSVPVAVYLLALWLLHRRPGREHRGDTLLFPLALAMIVASTWLPWTALIVGIATAGLAAGSVAMQRRPAHHEAGR
ncbi:low temperature requirement protein A [Aquisalimonas lutea]|uniref:low temperature requirement protein A n=1 Tax=Aquisalimonas lutea TaxID=1327750 RepID=UPI0025B38E8C|nr:low temperature requirement protein A [Aquisalimonas lutea]MDN3518498.1 low temperature requirement protein A [Aquisalimonas lutea]